MVGMFIAACCVFLIYIVAVFIRFSVPESISATHYLWGQAFNHGGILFTIFIWAVAFLSVPLWVSLAPSELTMIPFISCAALAFVGAAAMFKEELTAAVHYTSAGIWAAMVILYAFLTGNWPCVVGGAAVALLGMIFNDWKNITFWLEIGAVVIMISTISITI